MQSGNNKIARYQNMTSFTKKGRIADPNSKYLENRNLSIASEFGTTLKLGPNVPLT